MNNDGGCYQPRYPLANAPGSEIQQRNYEDWMDMCTNGESGLLFNDTANAVRDALIIGTGIAWAILSIPFPLASSVAGIFNVLIPYWWPVPSETAAPGTPEAQFTWNQMMSAVEELTDEKILESKRSDVIARWQGIQSLGRDYYQAICDLKADPSNESKKVAVRDAFDDIEDYIKISMPFFGANGFQVPMLAMYAQAANMHLLLLRDVVQHGRSWGFQQYEVDRYYSNVGSIGNPGLLQLLSTYTEYCITWYNTGLKKQYDTGDWNKFNDFRRDMTITALDIVALWPTYDPILYAVPTKSQLTRTVYTRIEGDTGGGNINVEQALSVADVERNVVDIPRLFTWLREITVDAIQGENSFVAKGRGIKHQYTLNGTIQEGGYQGELGTMRETLSLTSPDATSQIASGDVWQILTQNYRRFGGDRSSAVVGWVFKCTGFSDQPVFYRNPSSSYIYPAITGLPCRGADLEPCDPCNPTNPCRNEIVNPSEVCGNKPLYSHRLSYLGLGMLTSNDDLFVAPGTTYAAYFGYGWTHVSADAINMIDTEKITQIPAVKASTISGEARVVKGPASTGGDLVELSNGTEQRNMQLVITAPSGERTYRVRVRYASNMQTNIIIFMKDAFNDFSAPATTTDMTNLTYNKFGYLETLLYSYNEVENFTDVVRIYATGTDSGTFILDKIEFIPIEGSVEEYQADQDLEKAWKAVNALFTNDAKNALQLGVTDYDVDQAANKVDCMSDDVFPKEKMILLDQVKFAKRLSQKRNLLNDGDFESPDWSGGNGWKTSPTVYVAADNPIFKGRYLNMPGATSSPFTSNVYPTYAYQKVDESKLKPYTRYLVRGFVGSSNELELFVTRYGKEVHDKMNIPLNPMNTWNQPDRVPDSCGTGQVSGYTASSDPCQANAYTTATSGMMMPTTQGLCEEKRNFVFHIDVGEINQRANLGIAVGFNISSPTGMAQLSNVEVVEAKPLTGEALARVKKREQKWKRELEQKCAQTEKVVTAAQQAVNSLFTDARKDRLKATTTMQNIVNAEEKVNAIPYVYDSNFEDIPGMNFDSFTQLQSQVMNAFRLYGYRNAIQNGDFSSGLATWHATDGADVQERDGRSHVLAISNWSANVSQEVCVQPERGYVLRVTARKEGSGKGYVTISDCTEENTETVTFTANEDVTIPRPPVRPRRSATPSICDAPRYAESFGIVPDDNNMMNTSQASYGTASCSCGCGNTIHNQSENYQTKTYQSTSILSSMNGPSSDYITKTIEIFPEANRVRIEIGETEGSFLVESVELMCMED